jgi:hypothetical protein
MSLYLVRKLKFRMYRKMYITRTVGTASYDTA